MGAQHAYISFNRLTAGPGDCHANGTCTPSGRYYRAVYYPLDSSSAFQPYVGAGINYTWFFDTELSSEAQDKGFSGLDMKDSWGLAAQVGMDYMLTDSIMLNAQVRYIDIDTTGTTHILGDKVKVDVDVDPFVYMVGLGYKF